MKRVASIALVLALAYLLNRVISTGGPVPSEKRPPSEGPEVTTRLEVFRPVLTDEGWTWEPLQCDGTDILSRVGHVRLMGFATWAGPRHKSNEQFRVLYQEPSDSWYIDFNPVLPPKEEILVADVVQDLTPSQTDHRLKFKNRICDFRATDLPAESEGLISHRTPYADPVESIRIEVRRYSTDELLPCDGSVVQGAGRVKLSAFVVNDKDAVLDFHLHQERPADRFNGPSQEGDPATKRWWEVGFDNIRVKGGSEIRVTRAAAISTSGEGKNTFHFMQQHGARQEMIQAFCSFVNVPNR